MKRMLIAMESNHPLHYHPKTNSVKIVLDSQEICNDILRLGGKLRKSLNVKWPNVPCEYLPDFVRGFFDGDGCVYNSRNLTLASIVCGSKEFITGLENAVRKYVPDIGKSKSKKGGFYVRKRKGHRYLDLHISGYNVIKFGEYIYRGFRPTIMAMERKRRMFIAIMESSDV